MFYALESNLIICFGHIVRAIWEENFLCLKICHSIE